MRYVARIRLALLGLALAAPTAARAEAPGECKPCQEGRQHQHASRPPRLCARCQQARNQAMAGVPVAPTVVMAGPDGCTACQVQGQVVSMPPGYAVAGGPAPGYASVGGMIPSAEPTPIGVVQAGYQQAGAAGAMTAPGRASTGPMVPHSTPAMTGSSPTTLSHPGADRPRILSNLLGLPRLGGLRKAREEKERSGHAAISYGSAGQGVTDLPATMVYGR